MESSRASLLVRKNKKLSFSILSQNDYGFVSKKNAIIFPFSLLIFGVYRRDDQNRAVF